jgi:mRNA-degrading endonuclease RelE of RelBE toxin-antitoxin system
MNWTVAIHRRAVKPIGKLPPGVRNSLVALIRAIEMDGPVRGDWPNYGKLGRRRHHCHLKKGSPTYVAVWEVRNREINLVEITYAGTHEKAPY